MKLYHIKTEKTLLEKTMKMFAILYLKKRSW